MTTLSKLGLAIMMSTTLSVLLTTSGVKLDPVMVAFLLCYAFGVVLLFVEDGETK